MTIHSSVGSSEAGERKTLAVSDAASATDEGEAPAKGREAIEASLSLIKGDLSMHRP